MVHVNKSLKAHSGLAWQRDSDELVSTICITVSLMLGSRHHTSHFPTHCWNATQHTRNIFTRYYIHLHLRTGRTCGLCSACAPRRGSSSPTCSPPWTGPSTSTQTSSSSGGCGVELEMNLREDWSFTITEKIPIVTSSFSWLKAATTILPPSLHIWESIKTLCMLNWGK